MQKEPFELICKASGYQVTLHVDWQHPYPATLWLRLHVFANPKAQAALSTVFRGM